MNAFLSYLLMPQDYARQMIHTLDIAVQGQALGGRFNWLHYVRTFITVLYMYMHIWHRYAYKWARAESFAEFALIVHTQYVHFNTSSSFTALVL